MPANVLRFVLGFFTLLALFVAAGDGVDADRFGSVGFAHRPLGERGAVVTSVVPGSEAARAGVRPGDRIAADWLRPRGILGIAGSTTLRAGSQAAFYDVTLRKTVRVTTTRLPEASSVVRVTAYVLRILSLLLALALFWRFADDRAACALGGFLLLSNVQDFGNSGSFALGTGFGVVVGLLAPPLVALMLALFACWFPERHPAGIRRALSIGALAYMAVMIGVRALGWTYLATGHGPHLPTPLYLSLIRMVEPLAFASIVVAALAIDFRTASPLDRRRLEWIAVGMALEAYVFVARASFGPFFGVAGAPDIGGLMLLNASTLAGTFCLLYGFLRPHVLDISLATGRAAVFAVLSAFVVVVFFTVEYALDKYVEPRSHLTSEFVALGVALAIGFSLRGMHRYVATFADRTIFRSRYLGQNALQAFGRQAAFVTDESLLQERAMRALTLHAGAARAALYRLGSGGDYWLSASCEAQAHDRISAQDAVVLALKDERRPMHVNEDMVFPMFVRSELTGFVACGMRGLRDTFAPDELDTMQQMIERVGIALDALRTLRLENDLAEIRELSRAHARFSADGEQVLARIAEIADADQLMSRPPLT